MTTSIPNTEANDTVPPATTHKVGAANAVDEVVWVVGDEPILKSDIEVTRIQSMQEGIRWESEPECAIAENLAVQKLFLHQAQLDSIEVKDSEVAQEVESRITWMIQQAGSKEKLEEMRLSTLLTGEYDDSNAIVSLNAGAGGTESCDWCSMLYRMYTRWADRKGFSVEVMNYIDGDEAGIKSVDFQINGTNAYGYLKSERGVHRLVRISPFNAQGKRQTSFVSCDVMPDIQKDIDIVINPDDIRIDTYRSSGAGGQHINKTSSAIRITHFPTGIVVTCQNERSQFQNKDKAMQMLKAKLYMKKMEEEQAKLAGIRGEVKDIAWGSQIRSYVLQPYTLVKDTRTAEETSNTGAVLDGDIDRFINAYLKMEAGKAERENL